MPEAVDLQTPSTLPKIPLFVFFRDARRVFKMDALGSEILGIAFPAALALAADPIASLIDTAFVGRLGPVELAAVGVSIAIFNQASKITIFPVVSITTSFVAEEDTLERQNEANSQDKIASETNAQIPEDALEKGSAVASSGAETSLSKRDCDTKESSPSPPPVKNGVKTKNKKRHLPSASTALLFGTILGVLQAALLFFGGEFLLNIMGVKSDSPMLSPALKYLSVRALGAPAVLLSLAMQGVFRGFKDTKTPLYAIVIGDLANIVLDPILIFVCHLGVRGAAIAHVLSQYLTSLILVLCLMQKVYLMPPRAKGLQFGRFLKNGILLLARVIAVTFCVTLASSMAARLGTTPMAAFQISLQVWLTSSLLADGLAVAGQALLATGFAEKDYKKVTEATARVLQMSLVLGLALTVIVGAGLYFGSGIFSKDPAVLHLITIAVPFVAGTQPINTLAFVFDGINFGASDFAFTAYSMILVAAGSIASEVFLSRSNGFVGIWIALTIYMTLRAMAGGWRMGSGSGPWKFLRGQ